MLVLTGQEELTDPQKYSAFASLFGRVYKPPPSYPSVVPGDTGVTPIANTVGARGRMRWDAAAGVMRLDWPSPSGSGSAESQPEEAAAPYRNDNSMFHTDHAFLSEPSATTLLLPVVLPEPEPEPEPEHAGGFGLATEFISLAAARETLPHALAGGLAGRTALHSYGPGMFYRTLAAIEFAA